MGGTKKKYRPSQGDATAVSQANIRNVPKKIHNLVCTHQKTTLLQIPLHAYNCYAVGVRGDERRREGWWGRRGWSVVFVSRSCVLFTLVVKMWEFHAVRMQNSWSSN